MNTLASTAKNFTRRAATVAGYGIIALATLLIAITAVLPMARGLVQISILSSSMTAAGIPAGSLIFVKPVTDFASEVRVGSVVTVMPKADDPTLVTHRVTDISYSSDGPLVTLKGDSNPSPDPQPLPAIAVRAVLADVSIGQFSTPFVVPMIGEPYVKWQAWKESTGVQSAIPVIAWTLIAGGGVYFLASMLPGRKQKREAEGNEALIEAQTGV